MIVYDLDAPLETFGITYAVAREFGHPPNRPEDLARWIKSRNPEMPMTIAWYLTRRTIEDYRAGRMVKARANYCALKVAIRQIRQARRRKRDQ